jgi:hypothetical protein
MLKISKSHKRKQDRGKEMKTLGINKSNKKEKS